MSRPAKYPDPAADAQARLLRELLARHGRALRGFLAHLTADDRESVEAISREVLLDAVRHADRLPETPAEVRNRLLVAARNLAVRRNLAVVPARNLGAGRALAAFDLREAMRELRDEHRDVLIELYYRGHSVVEAARRLGIAPDIVTARCYFALHSLKLALEERGAAGGPPPSPGMA